MSDKELPSTVGGSSAVDPAELGRDIGGTAMLDPLYFF